ncbi:hypothetical protein [Pseudomonas proteolytica]
MYKTWNRWTGRSANWNRTPTPRIGSTTRSMKC